MKLIQPINTHKNIMLSNALFLMNILLVKLSGSDGQRPLSKKWVLAVGRFFLFIALISSRRVTCIE